MRHKPPQLIRRIGRRVVGLQLPLGLHDVLIPPSGVLDTPHPDFGFGFWIESKIAWPRWRLCSCSRPRVCASLARRPGAARANGQTRADAAELLDEPGARAGAAVDEHDGHQQRQPHQGQGDVGPDFHSLEGHPLEGHHAIGKHIAEARWPSVSSGQVEGDRGGTQLLSFANLIGLQSGSRSRRMPRMLSSSTAIFIGATWSTSARTRSTHATALGIGKHLERSLLRHDRARERADQANGIVAAAAGLLDHGFVASPSTTRSIRSGLPLRPSTRRRPPSTARRRAARNALTAAGLGVQIDSVSWRIWPAAAIAGAMSRRTASEPATMKIAATAHRLNHANRDQAIAASTNRNEPSSRSLPAQELARFRLSESGESWAGRKNQAPRHAARPGSRLAKPAPPLRCSINCRNE